MADLNKIVDELSSLTVMQAAELAKLLEEKWQVSTNFSSSLGVNDSDKVEPVQEKNEFDIILSTIGDKKIEVIKIVREITSLGLKDAKDLVDGAPKLLKKSVNKNELDSIRTKLESVGATIEVQ